MLDGRDATLGNSLRGANAKLHRILPWALLQATVAMVIQAIESRASWVGDVVANLLGAAWAVVTFLAVPVIMLEDLGPWNALKRSGGLLKQTWGENLAAQAGFGLLGLVAMLPGFALIGIGVATGEIALAVALGIVGVAWIAIVEVVISAMSGIYRTALYRYTVDGKAPVAFADADLEHAFGARRTSR